MGGGTASNKVRVETSSKGRWPDEMFGIEEAREILEAEGRYEEIEKLEDVVGNAGANVSINVYEDGTYEMKVSEKIVEGDDPFTRLANYLHGHRETFEGDLEPYYSDFKEDEAVK